MRLAHPLPTGRTTAWFGSYEGHRGHDYAAPTGTPILAAHDGVVSWAGWDKRGGWMVNIVSLDGSYGTSYQHMHKPASVRLGERVTAGQTLGGVGSTGYSTGPHLHLEYWRGGPVWGANSEAVDPLPHIEPPTGEEEDDDMAKAAGFYYTRSNDGAIMYLIVHSLGSGVYHEYTDGKKGVAMGGPYNNPVAAALGTGSYASITEGHARVIKAAEDRALARKISGEISATIETLNG